jgi:hypothetical protein
VQEHRERVTEREREREDERERERERENKRDRGREGGPAETDRQTETHLLKLTHPVVSRKVETDRFHEPSSCYVFPLHASIHSVACTMQREAGSEGERERGRERGRKGGRHGGRDRERLTAHSTPV